MNCTGTPWREYEVELLRKLWTEGQSARQISAQLPGRSRNACIGVVHRLGMPKRVQAGGRVYVPRKAMRRQRVRNMHITRVKPIPAPKKKPNKFDDSPASQAAAALLGAAYKREGLSL